MSSGVKAEAKDLSKDVLELIEHILVRHHESVLEVFKEQVLMLKKVRRSLQAYDEKRVTAAFALSEIEVAVNPERYRCDPL